MRFGTYFFLQATPSNRHADIIARELDQMVWSEQLGFDEVWLTHIATAQSGGLLVDSY
jgi:hypothetical protein